MFKSRWDDDGTVGERIERGDIEGRDETDGGEEEGEKSCETHGWINLVDEEGVLLGPGRLFCLNSVLLTCIGYWLQR